MPKIQLTPDSRGYVLAALNGLLRQGWQITGLPARGRLAANRQLLRLDSRTSQDSYRLLIFKVGESGRARQHERRVEITSTYVGGGLSPTPGVADVVLGYEPAARTFVGLSPKRLLHGGATQNASTFVDNESISVASVGEILVIQRDSALFGMEYQASFKADRIAEYLANYVAIHEGTYAGGGRYSGSFRREGRRSRLPAVPNHAAVGDLVVASAPDGEPASQSVNPQDLAALEAGEPGPRRGRGVSASAFGRMLRAMEQAGAQAEKHVLDAERRRLRALNRHGLAERVKWTSQENVAAGFDVESFEGNGTRRYIEVKSNVSGSLRFVMTKNEWRTAQRLKSRYWVYVVTDVWGSPMVHHIQDPVAVEAAGGLTKRPRDWAIEIT